mgnify:CR=1 FL=1
MSEDAQTYDDVIAQRRYNGFLTENDARHVLAEDTLSREETKDVRYRIRERTKSAIVDLGFLANQMNPAELRMVFRDLVEEPSGHELDAMAFFYLGLSSIDDWFDDDLESTFELFVRASIQRGESLTSRVSDPTVDIQINRLTEDPEGVRERLLNGTGGQLQLNYLQQEGELQPLLEAVVERDEPLFATPEQDIEANGSVSLSVKEAADLLDEITEAGQSAQS